MAEEKPRRRQDTYILPNSEIENDRLDSQHHLLTKTFGGLYRASLDTNDIHRVLDIGCGTGNWASDFAAQHPNVEVIGIDIEEKPGRRTSPSNFHFQISDLHSQEHWSKLGTFDYIHARFIAVSVRDWPGLLENCFFHLRSGGLVEFQELQFPFQCSPPSDASSSRIVEWSNLMIQAGASLGLDTALMSSFPSYLEKAGFVDIKTEEFSMYTGPWMDDENLHDLAQMGQKNLMTGLYGFSEILFTNVLGWSKDRYYTFIEETVEEMRTMKYKTWLPMKVNLARKPHIDETFFRTD